MSSALFNIEGRGASGRDSACRGTAVSPGCTLRTPLDLTGGPIGSEALEELRGGEGAREEDGDLCGDVDMHELRAWLNWCCLPGTWDGPLRRTGGHGGLHGAADAKMSHQRIMTAQGVSYEAAYRPRFEIGLAGFEGLLRLFGGRWVS